MIDLCCTWGAHWPRPGMSDRQVAELCGVYFRWFSCPLERALHQLRRF